MSASKTRPENGAQIDPAKAAQACRVIKVNLRGHGIQDSKRPRKLATIAQLRKKQDRENRLDWRQYNDASPEELREDAADYAYWSSRLLEQAQFLERTRN